MTLIARLIGDGADKIPVHQFMALCAEYQRGVPGVDAASIASDFAIVDAGELDELSTILLELVNRRSDRDVIHDALLLGELALYDESTVESRVASPTGDTDLEAITFRQVYRIQNFAHRGNFAFSGCNVNAKDPRALAVEVTGGSILTAGRTVAAVDAVDTLPISSPSASLPRVDLVYCDSDGNVLIREGEPELVPKAPSVAFQEVALAFVFVAAGATSIKPGAVQDVRVIRDHGTMRIGRKANPQTVTNDGSFNVLWSQMVPPGLLNGQTVRLVLAGTATIDGVLPCNLDFRVRYGSTQLYRDSTPVLVKASTPMPWRAELEISGTDDSAQVLSGRITVGDSGSPNVGVGQIAGSLSQVLGIVKGEASEDSTAMLDVDFAVRMGEADAANSVTVDWAYAELV